MLTVVNAAIAESHYVRLECAMGNCRYTSRFCGKSPLHVQLLASLDGWANNRQGEGVVCPVHARQQNKDQPWA